MNKLINPVQNYDHPQFINSSEYPLLIALQGPLEGKKWEIKDKLSIGREPTCDIFIDDRQVSRQHARVTNNEVGKIELEDLTSKNGTFHRGTLLDKKIQLEDGDVIQIALIQKFAFYTSDATMPLEDIFPSTSVNTQCIRLDPKSRRVWVNGEELNPALSAPQFRLLYALSMQQGKVISRNELIGIVWKDDLTEGVSDQALDALIRRLRTRLAQIDPEKDYIVTVRGHGLRLDD
jgi:DNA-binding winged helix-turn-helix (wHTH) protein